MGLEEITKVLIFNPGVHPELLHIAKKLSIENVDFDYLTCLTFGYDSWVAGKDSNSWHISFLKKSLAKRITFIPESKILRVASVFDLLLSFTTRWLPFTNRILFTFRNRTIERVACKKLSNVKYDFVILQHTAGHKLIELATSIGIPVILNYSIAHHQWSQNLSIEEEKLNPKWAPYLQFPSNSHRERMRLNREIELCNWILVGSNFVKRTFIDEKIDGSKIKVIHLGVDLSEIGTHKKDDSRIYRRSRTKFDPIHIIFVGQLTQRKGLSYLIEAFSNANLPQGSTLQLVGHIPFPSIKNPIVAEIPP